MTRGGILAIVSDLIEDIVGVNGSDIAENKTFAELSILEIDLVEVTVAAEESFRIRISDGEMADLKTVGEIVDLVQAKIPAGRIADWERELLEQQAKRPPAV